MDYHARMKLLREMCVPCTKDKSKCHPYPCKPFWEAGEKVNANFGRIHNEMSREEQTRVLGL